MASEFTYELQTTKEQIGDAPELTAAHINRVLKVLEEGLIRRPKREVAIVNWRRPRRAADFNLRYLLNAGEPSFHARS